MGACDPAGRCVARLRAALAPPRSPRTPRRPRGPTPRRCSGSSRTSAARSRSPATTSISWRSSTRCARSPPRRPRATSASPTPRSSTCWATTRTRRCSATTWSPTPSSARTRTTTPRCSTSRTRSTSRRTTSARACTCGSSSSSGSATTRRRWPGTWRSPVASTSSPASTSSSPRPRACRAAPSRRSSPTSTPSGSSAATTWRLEERVAKAQAIFQTLADAPGGPFRVQAAYFIGVGYVKVHQWDKALAQFDAVKKMAPRDDKDKKVARAGQPLARGAWPSRWASSTRPSTATHQVPQQSDNFPDALYEVSWAYVRKGEYQKAKNATDILLLVAEDSVLAPEAKILQGTLLQKMQKYDDSVDTYNQVINTYAPVRDEIDALLTVNKDPVQYFDELLAAKREVARRDPAACRPSRSSGRAPRATWPTPRTSPTPSTPAARASPSRGRSPTASWSRSTSAAWRASPCCRRASPAPTPSTPPSPAPRRTSPASRPTSATTRWGRRRSRGSPSSGRRPRR